MKSFFAFLLLFISTLSRAQMGLPIQTSLLPKNNLVVNYDFSNPAGFTRGATTATNLAGSASGNPTLYNSPIFMNSLGFISFNGSNQYLATPNIRTYFKSVNTSTQRSFTMSFWFYPLTATGVLVSELDSHVPSGGWHASNVEILNGFIKYRIWNGPIITSSSAVSLNQWHHIALVYDGTSVKGYLNGVLQGTQAGAREIPPTSQNYAIGASETTNMGAGNYGNFHLAQFKIHNLPLTDKEILSEYETRKDEFDYSIHSPSTNSNPTYWGISSAWDGQTTFSQDHYTPWLNNARLGWAASANNTSQWITLNYDEPAYIKGVVVQGRVGGGQLVTKAHVETSLTGSEPWTRVLNNVTVNNTTSPLNDVRLNFPTNTFAKTIRVVPTEWSAHITMRLGMLVKPLNYVTEGLVLNLDPSNIKSYQVSGNTLFDLTTNANHATLTGTPSLNTSNGLTFNGTSQYGRIPSLNGVSNFTNTQQYSIEIWFNPSNGQPNAGEAELLEKWNLNNESRYPYTIRFNENGSSMLVAAYDGSSFPSVSVPGFPVNTWKQLVAVFDFVAKTLVVYRDGVSVGSTSLNLVGQVSNTSPVGIAGRVVNGTGSSGFAVPFKGTIGIIRMYNTSLTASQVLQNFNANKLRYGL